MAIPSVGMTIPMFSCVTKLRKLNGTRNGDSNSILLQPTKHAIKVYSNENIKDQICSNNKLRIKSLALRVDFYWLSLTTAWDTDKGERGMGRVVFFCKQSGPDLFQSILLSLNNHTENNLALMKNQQFWMQFFRALIFRNNQNFN